MLSTPSIIYFVSMNEDRREELLIHPSVVLAKKQAQWAMRLKSYNRHFSFIENIFFLSKTSFTSASLAMYLIQPVEERLCEVQATTAPVHYLKIDRWRNQGGWKGNCLPL